MSVWELAAFVDGYNQSQGEGEKVDAPSDDEFEAMLALHKVQTTN